MENLEDEILTIHQETLNAEACTMQALSQSGMVPAPLMDRAVTSLGDLLISLGTRLKKHASARLTTDEASTASFIIML